MPNQKYLPIFFEMYYIPVCLLQFGNKTIRYFNLGKKY